MGEKKSSASRLMATFGLKIKSCTGGPTFQNVMASTHWQSKLSQRGTWVARGLRASMWCPDNNIQVKKSLWTYRHRRSKWGKNQKCILLLPNVHKEVLPNSVCELLVTPTSRMGILGTFSWPCSPCPGCKRELWDESGLHLPVVFPVQRIVLGNSWSPRIWGQFL